MEKEKVGKVDVAQILKYVVITLGIVGLLFYIFWFIYVFTNDTVDSQPPQMIRCVSDTVLQPDGSCTPQERGNARN